MTMLSGMWPAGNLKLTFLFIELINLNLDIIWQIIIMNKRLDKCWEEIKPANLQDGQWPEGKEWIHCRFSTSRLLTCYCLASLISLIILAKFSGVWTNCRCCWMAVVSIHGLTFFLASNLCLKLTQNWTSLCAWNKFLFLILILQHSFLLSQQYWVLQPIAQTTYGFDGDQEKLAQNLLNIKVMRYKQSKVVFQFLVLVLLCSVSSS